MEEWRDIPFTNGEYQVSRTGKVRTAKTGRILKPCIDQRGYERVCLFKENRGKRYRVHRLVAISFIPNPHEKQQVNHKDGNKRNNSVENLEWATNVENMHHSRENGFHDGLKRYCNSKKKCVIATHIESGEQTVFGSILAAKTAIGTCHIQEVLRGVRGQAKGFTFRYEEVVPDADIDNMQAERSSEAVSEG